MPRRHSKPIEIRMPTVRYADFYVKLQIVDGADLAMSVITPEGYLYNAMYPGGYLIRPSSAKAPVPLKPCPICQSNPVVVLVEYGIKYSKAAQAARYSASSTTTMAHAIYCGNDRECGLRSPIRQDLDVAAKIWNSLTYEK